MNKAISLLALIKSLSKAEKRYLKLYSNLQNGEKGYLILFELLENNTSIDDIYKQFCIKQKGKSFDMAVKHLYKVVLNCLVHLNKQQDIQTQIFDYISKAGILFERELLNEALSELEKAEKLAIHYENDSLILLIRRTELKYLSMYDFTGMSEKQVVDKQMKINEIMRYTRSANLHTQLYDILKYRFTYKGRIRSDKQKENLNDLVLSELNLIASSSYKGFETEKLHLLFQSTYFLNSGNYKAAIRLYQDLILLFDENKHMILNPPLYYLNAILGVLDSLQSVGLYKEMPFFISRLKEMEKGDYSAEFRLTVQVYIYLYEFYSLFNTGNFKSAQELQQQNEEPIFKKISLLELNLQLQLYLSLVILHIGLKDLKEARKNMKKILSSGKSLYIFPTYRIARLVNLILQAELGNYDYFENEIKSIKRSSSFETKQYITEKLLFKFIQSYPLPKSKQYRNKLWSYYQQNIQKIEEDKYERPLLKTFDFCAWIKSKLTDNPFDIIIKEQNEKIII
ncbi:MAG: hypothetical protein LUD40_18715 [Phocaeicola dorei]|nr:hypothetical protein [Phocaeicola dorei]